MSYNSQTSSLSFLIDVHAVASLLLMVLATLKPVPVFLRVCMCVYCCNADTFFVKRCNYGHTMLCSPDRLAVHAGKPGRPLALVVCCSTPMQG